MVVYKCNDTIKATMTYPFSSVGSMSHQVVRNVTSSEGVRLPRGSATTMCVISPPPPISLPSVLALMNELVVELLSEAIDPP